MTTGIYMDDTRHPLHLLRPHQTPEGLFTYHTTCPTPYAPPMTVDPEVFRSAMDEGRSVCNRCADYLAEQTE